MYQIVRIVICLLGLIGFGCVTDYDGSYPLSKQTPVVNCMLFPDSLIRVDVSWSGHPDEHFFAPVLDAHIEILEDGFRIGEPLWEEGKGFVFDHFVQSGSRYDLKVIIPNHDTITSTTLIPAKSPLSCVPQEGGAVFEMEVKEKQREIHAYYIFMYHLIGNEQWEHANQIYCDSPLADPFNRVMDSMAPKGFSYVHDFFIRCATDDFVDGCGRVKFRYWVDTNDIKVYILAATKEFDLYFKAAFWQRYYDPFIQLPFTYQTIHLPTNMIGCPGVFAGCDVYLFEPDI